MSSTRQFKENETTELKESTSELKEAIISISSILNKHGKGALYFGIEDYGKVVGRQTGKSTVKDISKSITDHIDPKIYPDIKVQNIMGKDCIVISFSGHENLYSAFGRFYLRTGDENKKLSSREIEHLVEKKKNYVYRWGFEASETPVSEADIPTLRSFVKKGKEAGRIAFAFDTAKNVLNKLNLVKGNNLLNTGRALFYKNNGIEVQTAVFAGHDRITFLDIQSFHGTLFELIEKSEAYVKEHINWRADLSGSHRKEIPEIPVRAITEAIVNSLCHRDFSNPKGNEVAIFKNRIEIYNPGRFPEDYSPEDFIKGKEHSILRNPLIANAFYLASDIERWGSGLKRICVACKESGVKVEFKNLKSGFAVIFYRPNFQQIQAAVRKGGQISGQKRWSELTKKQKAVLNAINKNPKISRKHLSNCLNINPSAVQKHIQKLKKIGFLIRVGPDKGGHWDIIDK